MTLTELEPELDSDIMDCLSSDINGDTACGYSLPVKDKLKETSVDFLNRK